MTSVDGLYYDGRSSREHRVLLSFDDSGRLIIQGIDLRREFNRAEIKASPQLGKTRRNIYLPDGAKCEIENHDAVDHFLSASCQNGFDAWLHGFESKSGYALLALALSVIIVAAGTIYGIPVLARQVAFSLPESADNAIGVGALEAMDRTFFKESTIDIDTQNRIHDHFRWMANQIGNNQSYHLEFRHSDIIGPNAFALPSGIVIVTDDLVRYAEDDNELIAILAHELGHLKNRHSLRMVLHGSAVVVLISTITGDIASITALAAAIPTQLIESKYSRDFEREADRFAHWFMTENHIPLHHFSNIMQRISTVHGEREGDHAYFASHPATAERIRLFKETGG